MLKDIISGSPTGFAGSILKMSAQEEQGKLLPRGSGSRNGGEREVKLMRIWRESESKAKRIFLTYLFLAVNQLNNRRRKTWVSQRLPRSPERKTPSENTKAATEDTEAAPQPTAAAEQGQDWATGGSAGERRAQFQKPNGLWRIPLTKCLHQNMSWPQPELVRVWAEQSLLHWASGLASRVTNQLTLSGITGIPWKSRKRDNFMI